MNILILMGSPRRNGNTDRLAKAFAEGARENGHNVETIAIGDYHIGPCIGCDSCFKREGNTCFQDDDMHMVYDKLAQADMLVIASPVYFYGISSQLKAMIDRCHNPLRDSFRISKAALLLVGAAHLPELFDSILTQYRLCLNFFNIEDCGHILVRGVKDKGDIDGMDCLHEAFEMGKSI